MILLISAAQVARSRLSMTLLICLVTGASLVVAQQPSHDHAAPSKFVQIVRAATQHYIDFSNASPDYGSTLWLCQRSEPRRHGMIQYVNVGLLQSRGQIKMMNNGVHRDEARKLR